MGLLYGNYIFIILLLCPTVLFYAISIYQVKRPILTEMNFNTALKEHNKHLVDDLLEGSDINATISMDDEMNHLRLSLRGYPNGEKSDVKMVFHMAMGIGDPELPARIEWLPSLLCCFAMTTVLTVAISICSYKTIDKLMDEKAYDGGIHDISTKLDVILNKRKIENPHRTVETTEDRMGFDSKTAVSTESARVFVSVTPAVICLLILFLAIVIQALILEAAHGGGIAIKVFGIFRRAASLSPMECETVLDYIILVLNFPTQIIFYLTLARIASFFNVFFYCLFGKVEKEKPQMLADY